MHGLPRRYARVRARTEELAAPLSAEDQQIQSTPLASPTKWHRAHTTWFFETFVLATAGVAPFDRRWGVLFNSYYEGAGSRIGRGVRGLLSRPSAEEVGVYRRVVDARMQELIERIEDGTERSARRLVPIIELGLAHEEQHQELLLTDALHALAQNPLEPVYRPSAKRSTASSSSSSSPHGRWSSFPGGVVEMGAPLEGFSFDHERPRHRVLLEPFALATRPVTVREAKAFIREGGYRTPSLWLAAGFEIARTEGWEAPLYARMRDGVLQQFSLAGIVEPDDDDPVSHVSFYEADALARFLGARLPTEAEWEHAAQSASPDEGNFADGPLAPRASSDAGLTQIFGDVWEWTQSSYGPYPGFVAESGTLGEYNGKFMAQQMVLRGGSCFTPRGHVRASYRNYWPPETRFQMSGVRLARG